MELCDDCCQMRASTARTMAPPPYRSYLRGDNKHRIVKTSFTNQIAEDVRSAYHGSRGNPAYKYWPLEVSKDFKVGVLVKSEDARRNYFSVWWGKLLACGGPLVVCGHQHRQSKK